MIGFVIEAIRKAFRDHRPFRGHIGRRCFEVEEFFLRDNHSHRAGDSFSHTSTASRRRSGEHRFAAKADRARQRAADRRKEAGRLGYMGKRPICVLLPPAQLNYLRFPRLENEEKTASLPV